MSEQGEELPERADPGSARELVAKSRVNVADIRSEEEFAEQRISTAKHVGAEAIGERAAELAEEREGVLIVCADGERSGEIAAELRDEGVNALSIEGGFEAWVDDGQPTAPAPDDEYEGPATTVPGAVGSSGGEDEDEDDGEDDG